MGFYYEIKGLKIAWN